VLTPTQLYHEGLFGRLWEAAITLLVLDVLASPSCCSGDNIVCTVELVGRSNLYRHAESTRVT